METRFDFVLELPGLDLAIAAIEAGVVAGLEAEGQATVADMQQRAPVDTGFLRDHISYSLDASEPSLTLESAAPYSYFQDAGTRHMPAHPFFTPAWDQMTTRLPQTVADAIAKAERG